MDGSRGGTGGCAAACFLASLRACFSVRRSRSLLSRARFRYHLHPTRAIGDTTYGTVDNIVPLEDAGIRLPHDQCLRRPDYARLTNNTDTEFPWQITETSSTK